MTVPIMKSYQISWNLDATKELQNKVKHGTVSQSPQN